MKRILFFSLVAVLLSPVPVNADLMVYEYIPGEKVTLDSNTGKYWYWNLPDFVNMTYDDQITAIAGLGTYGYIAGGWHMATLTEFQGLWNHNGIPEIFSSFATVTVFTTTSHMARYDFSESPGHHNGELVLRGSYRVVKNT